MKINYKIDKERELIIETWPEKVTVEDFEKVKLSEFSDTDFNSAYNVITDLRKVKMVFDEELIKGIVSFMKLNSDKIKNRKSAIIALSPQLVAGSLFFGQKKQKLSVTVSVFSSINAAYKWIKEN
ncbi:MAG: hypothetical protein J7K64_05995 [Bacteroidales bacterium]|nr:hypothetical protein [Bacteroidales bacterium]